MTTYYAVNPVDENDQVQLSSTREEDAIAEMEQLKGYDLRVEADPKDYAFTISFSVLSDRTEDDLSNEEIRKAVLAKVLDAEINDRWRDIIEVFDVIDK